MSGRTFALDTSFTLVRAAAEADGPVVYIHADAAKLPFGDATFDLVTAYNVLMDVDDLAASLAEVARVVAPDGRLVACVLHPFAEAGTFEAREPGARFIVEDGYFVESDYRRTFSRRGHEITCSSSRYTLEAYVGKLAAAGFAVEAVREPRPDPAALVRDPSEERWARVPLFLFFSARKVADAHRPPEP